MCKYWYEPRPHWCRSFWISETRWWNGGNGGRCCWRRRYRQSGRRNWRGTVRQRWRLTGCCNVRSSIVCRTWAWCRRWPRQTAYIATAKVINQIFTKNDHTQTQMETHTYLRSKATNANYKLGYSNEPTEHNDESDVILEYEIVVAQWKWTCICSLLYHAVCGLGLPITITFSIWAVPARRMCFLL